MNKISEWFDEHKGMLIAGTIFVVLLVVVSVAILNFRSARQAEIESQNAQQEQTSEQEPKNEQALNELSDEQKKLIEGYSDDVQNELSLLKANVWTDGSEHNYIKFGDNYFIDSNKKGQNQADDSVQPFVVKAIKSEMIDGSNTQVTTLSIENDSGKSSILSVYRETKQNADGSNLIELSIKCDLFSSTSAYKRADSAEFLTVNLVTDDVLKYIDNRRDDCVKAITDYCSLNYPSVTTVTFNGIVNFDLTQNFVVLQFNCNNKSNTKLQVIYSSNKEFSVSEGSNAISQ